MQIVCGIEIQVDTIFNNRLQLLMIKIEHITYIRKLINHSRNFTLDSIEDSLCIELFRPLVLCILSKSYAICNIMK